MSFFTPNLGEKGAVCQDQAFKGGVLVGGREHGRAETLNMGERKPLRLAAPMATFPRNLHKGTEPINTYGLALYLKAGHTV